MIQFSEEQRVEFEISEDDVANVLRQHAGNTSLAKKLFEEMDIDAVTCAALAGGCDLDDQTSAAYEEITRQLIDQGALVSNLKNRDIIDVAKAEEISRYLKTNGQIIDIRDKGGVNVVLYNIEQEDIAEFPHLSDVAHAEVWKHGIEFSFEDGRRLEFPLGKKKPRSGPTFGM